VVRPGRGEGGGGHGGGLSLSYLGIFGHLGKVLLPGNITLSKVIENEINFFSFYLYQIFFGGGGWFVVVWKNLSSHVLS
jgi:hypothetical protein